MQAPGVLPVLQAVASGRTDLSLDALDHPVVEHALATGLAPLLAHATRDGTAGLASPYAARIRAADLTAQVLTADKYDALEELLPYADAAGCRPVLLKGVSTAARYYPAPHLRTMGDVDLLVPAHRQDAIESVLRTLGYVQASERPPSAFIGTHHSMPFWHPDRRVWIEIHTRLHPPDFPLAGAPVLPVEDLGAELSPLAIGSGTAAAMTHELQLVYTSARWAEMLEPERGAFPVLDAALLIRTCGGVLNWDRLLTIAGRSWAATALHLMLRYLAKWDLARVPGEVLHALASADRYTNGASRALLHRMVTRYVMEGRAFGRLRTRHNLRIIWWTITRPAAPAVNFSALPYYVLFPPRVPYRFHPLYLLHRMASAFRARP